MKHFFFVLFCTLFLAGNAPACPSPTNIEGVAFTDSEEIDFSKIEKFGKEGVHYYKNEDSTRTGYRYISHYNPYAMVFVGNYGLAYTDGCRINCMGVIVDDSIASGTDTSSFNFAGAVVTELEWLSEKGIVALSADKIKKISSALYKTHGGMQYWTCCDNVLAYNSWYEYDEKTGVWGGGGVDGVKGVRGGCSVVKEEYKLLPQELQKDITEIQKGFDASANTHYRFSAAPVGAGGIRISFNTALRKPAKVEIINIQGSVVSEKRVSAGMSSVKTENNTAVSGIYFVRLISGDIRALRKIMVITK